jgi:hypothetical protein
MSDRIAFSVLGANVVVEAPSPEVGERLRACYGHALQDGGDGAVRGAVLRSGGEWSVAVDGRPGRSAPDVTAAVRALNHELMHALMLRDLRRVYVHAGVVAVPGGAIVLPGASRAGKSTLVLALLRAGARLLSDELLAYEPDRGLAVPFPRAVKVRDECVPYFPEYRGRFVGAGEGRFLPLAALGAEAVAAPAVPRVIAAPRWDARAEDRLTPLSSGEGLLRLAESMLNFGAHAHRSIDHLAAMIERADSFILSWRDPRAAAELLLGVLAARPD